MTSALKQKLDETMFGGLMCGTIALGRKLGLFKALHDVASKDAPADAKTVADKASCKERYVREWLSAMACAGFIEITPEEKFYITDDHYKEFEGFNNLSISMMAFLPSIMKTYEQLADAFRKEGRYGLEYAEFNDFYGAMNEVTQAMHSKHLVQDYFPQIGWSSTLEKGGVTVLDVGCGSGWHAITMAEAYPKCTFVGADISEHAIGVAKQSANAAGLSNVEFHVMDAGHMSLEWTNKFDYITIFDACHDQMRPDLCLNEIYRMLKPKGVFAMLEVNGTSNAYKDKQANASFASAFYAISMFHCLPVGSNSKDALCMGAMWGEGRAVDLLRKAGFSQDHVKVFRPEYFPINIVYLCEKA